LDMKNAPARRKVLDEDANIEREARRILRRLCESRAFLLVSPELENAAVFRESVPGKRTRTAVVEREVAQAFVLNEWIEGKQAGKVGIYSITTTGKAALKRMLSEERNGRQMAAGMDGTVTPFQAQHQTPGDRVIVEDGRSRKIRCNLAESPLTILARKKGPDGATYISPAMLDAGERLREDFEIAQMGPRVTQNWDNFLTASSHGQFSAGNRDDGPSAARDRVGAAMKALGPGLADIAFRCCCFLEGLEVAEKRLGWSARAGKVVLRIALSRLVEHYAEAGDNRMIGQKIND